MPDVSVVMSVYNGACHLSDSIESILSQDGVDFEFIIVNDGSTDKSSWILEEYAARDQRIRIIHQENQGLTKALIRGCAEAKGEFIARQDADEIAYPGRFRKQLGLARLYPEATLISCGVRFVGPKGEVMFDVLPEEEDGTSSLLVLELDKLRGVSAHGSAFFPRSVYEAVGGYRAPFKKAQDVDLWVRLAERGAHKVVREVLLETIYTLDGISSGNWERQKDFGGIILESARARRSGADDSGVLKKMSCSRRTTKPSWKGLSRSRAAYFIGSALRSRGDIAARQYFLTAFQTNPFHLKALFRMVQGYLGI